jgi:hypothetical protein
MTKKAKKEAVGKLQSLQDQVAMLMQQLGE